MVASTTRARPSRISAIHPAGPNSPRTLRAFQRFPPQSTSHARMKQALQPATPARTVPTADVFVFASPALTHPQCSQSNTAALSPLCGSLSIDSICFHQLTSSFLQAGGYGGCLQSNIQMTSLFISRPKGEKPQTAWGEAIRGLGAYIEDWALRSSLKLSVARPL
jgi:hypothetical protein